MITGLSTRLAVLSAALAAELVVVSSGFAQTASPAVAPATEACSRTWVGHETEIDWHLFLIDHSRAFTSRTSLDGIAVPAIIDQQLWDRIESLTPADLDRELGTWLSDGKRKAVFARRDRIRTAIARRVKDKGVAKGFLE